MTFLSKQNTGRFILIALFGALAAAEPGYAKTHTLEIEPYIWGHHVSGQFAAGQMPPLDVDWKGSEISAGFSGRAAYRHPSGWGMIVSGFLSSGDYSGSTALPEFPAGLINASMGRMLLAPAWELPLHSDNTVRLFAGAQMSSFSLETRLTRADFSYIAADDSRTWWDPMIGTEVRHFMDDHWFMHGSAGIGGFGVNSRLTSSLIGAVGYQFDPLLSVKFGYRFEINDYEKDGLLLDGTHQGFLLGLQFNI